MIVRSPTRLLFAVLAAIAALFLAFAVLPEGPTARAAPHPDYPAMLVGGDGSHGRAVIALSWAFGALQVALFSVLVAMGAGRRALERGLLKPLVRGSIVYLFAWTFLVAGYRGWLQGTSDPSLLGLPLPTAMLLFVIWPLPVFYVYLYVRHFKRFVFDEEDAAHLERLASEHRSR
jgi:hypothetical protein